MSVFRFPYFASPYFGYPAGFRVQATAVGFYGGRFRLIGDVFDLVTGLDFSDSGVSSVPPGNPDYPLYGWMQRVLPATPLLSQSPVQAQDRQINPRRTVY